MKLNSLLLYLRNTKTSYEQESLIVLTVSLACIHLNAQDNFDTVQDQTCSGGGESIFSEGFRR